MNIPIYQIDSFTDHLFGGNPAAICPLDEWLDDEVLLKIAIENNLAETAYFVKNGGGYHLRWFTPEIEMDLCGHATLASAHVLFKHLNYPGDEIVFQSVSGELIVERKGELLEMDFPSRMPEPSDAPARILDSLSIQPSQVMKSRDYFLIYNNEEEVRSLQVDQNNIAEVKLGPGGIICTAKGDDVDFVSRFFTPGAAVFEDPVTGSAHCSLIPYWAKALDKEEMLAHQISERLGVIHCRNADERVFISGNAVTYLEGSIAV